MLAPERRRKKGGRQYMTSLLMDVYLIVVYAGCYQGVLVLNSQVWYYSVSLQNHEMANMFSKSSD